MPKSLYVASTAPGNGKTSIIAALARRWQNMGVPVSCQDPAANALVGEGSGDEAKVVLVEGSPSDTAEASALVTRFSREMDLRAVKSAADALGSGLVGVIVNRVPKLGMRLAEEEQRPALESAGLRVLGLVPEGRALFGITVDGLVSRLEGEYAVEGEGRDQVVEHVMVGANVLDAEDFPAGPEYFGQRERKAVIARGDRPDFQWAAMNTDTRCLILTGDHQPIPYVVERAKELQVPIAVVRRDTLDTLDAIDEILSGPSLDSESKLREFTTLVDSTVDASALDTALGLP